MEDKFFMVKTFYKVTTMQPGADKPSKYIFDVREKAMKFLEEQDNGELDVIEMVSEEVKNYYDGCTYNELVNEGW